MESADRRNAVLVIIPAFNEGESVAAVIGAVRGLSLGLELLVVDDGSTDRTARAASAAGADVVSLPFNLGYGIALQTGFKYAERNGYDFVLHMDADGQHDPRSIPDLLGEIRKGAADMVIGSRFLKEPGYPLEGVKRLGIVIFRAITGRVLGRRITDPTSGFQALSRKAFVFLARNYPSDYPDADVLINVHRAGLVITEIPARMHPRAAGKSMHSGLKPAYYVFKMFLSIFVTLLRRRPETARREE